MTGKSIKTNSKYKVIGLMSGTSMDGLDLTCCTFNKTQHSWRFNMIDSQTVGYNQTWREKLSKAHHLSGEELRKLDLEYGSYLGSACNNFVKKKKLSGVDFIASHGHTIFHQPQFRMTFQLGNGVALNETSGIPVVSDFRSLDVLKGGQGAPLVPVGDHHLFAEYNICLNLGGIANLSMLKKGKRIAHDICYANMGLNYLSEKLNKTYDRNGKIASQGEINIKLLKNLTDIYATKYMKKQSLGREGFEKDIMPLLENSKTSIADMLRTFLESMVIQIKKSFGSSQEEIRILVTGGGALNKFFIHRLRAELPKNMHITIPEKSIVNYKEAIVFGFLGLLRVRGEINVLKSVTGATSDSCAGTMTGF